MNAKKFAEYHMSEESIIELEKALDICKKNNKNTSSDLALLQGILEYSKRDYKKARINFEKAMNITKSEMLGALVSSLYIELGEYEKAKETILIYIKKYPSNEILNELMGITYLKTGEYDNAFLN